jgi:hypothetical protein
MSVNKNKENEMTENAEKDILDLSESSAYTYKVTMIIQVIAPNKEIADAKLDKDGGYVSKRDVEFMRSIVLYKEIEESEDK